MGGGAKAEGDRGSEAAAGDDGAVSAQGARQPTESSAGKGSLSTFNKASYFTESVLKEIHCFDIYKCKE